MKKLVMITVVLAFAGNAFAQLTTNGGGTVQTMNGPASTTYNPAPAPVAKKPAKHTAAKHTTSKTHTTKHKKHTAKPAASTTPAQ